MDKKEIKFPCITVIQIRDGAWSKSSVTVDMPPGMAGTPEMEVLFEQSRQANLAALDLIDAEFQQRTSRQSLDSKKREA